uniref:Defensin-like protein n=1 Tax=Aegilops tauschii subsp. strangulata TaxID=200361 RepID=A0A453GY62_AEGTS
SRNTKKKFVCDLMEGKPILVCLMVLFLLVNSTHAENCKTHIAYSGTSCDELTCRLACQHDGGGRLTNGNCVVVNVSVQECNCAICD